MRKLIFAAALAAAASAQAQSNGMDWFAKTPNDVGGEIVLTTVQGACDKGSHTVFSADPGGRVVYGCWFPTSTHIHVTYENGQRRAYDFTGWVVNPQFSSRRAPTGPSY